MSNPAAPPSDAGGKRSALERRLAGLSPKKRALLELQLKKKGMQIGAVAEGPAPIAPRSEQQPHYPLSFAQQRLWFIEQMSPGSPAYHIATPKRIIGMTLDFGALGRALATIVDRHEALRTTFSQVDGVPVQVVHPRMAVPLPLIDLSGLSGEAREYQALRLANEHLSWPFDFERGPLLRTAVLRLRATEHTVLLTMHHIVSDGWSLTVFFNELMSQYAAESTGQASPLAPLAVQYVDFTLWQRDFLRGEELDRQLDYWRQQLAGAPPLMALPTDRQRPPLQSYLGRSLPVPLAPELAERVRSLSREAQVTPFVTLLAVYAALIADFTGEEDLVIGSPIAGRNREEIEDLIGFFVNTLVLRLRTDGQPSFRELLARAGEVQRGANSYQDLPFEKLVEEIAPVRSLEFNPIFQVAFAYQRDPNLGATGSAGDSPAGSAGDSQGAVQIGAQAQSQEVSNFDLWMTFLEGENSITGSLSYSTALFDPTTALRLARRFPRFLAAALDNPDAGLWSRPAWSHEERHQLLVEWRSDTLGERLSPEEERPLHAFFEDVAARQPQVTALSFRGTELSYGELNRRANRVAHHLLRRGVQPGTLVGLAADRSLELVVGLLGILKAGGAYVPLDPSYPEYRLRGMMEQTGLRLLLAQPELATGVPEAVEEVIHLSSEAGFLAEESEQNPGLALAPEHLAYVVFTSGSTGRPKGVAVPHRAVVRLVRRSRFADLGPEQTFLLLAPVAFDASTLELWGPLLNGGRLAIAPPGQLELDSLSRVLREEEVSIVWLTAGLFHLMAESQIEGLSGLQQLLAGGDVLSPLAVRAVLARQPNLTLVNGYGPTENTTFTCCHRMPGRHFSRREASRPPSSPVPIGRPVTRTGVLILDRHLQPVPMGVPGELYTGGEGLARGYLDQPALTAERFLPDPTGQRAGARIYRTGDQARWMADGAVDFLGRGDQQVKIRGFRIELGEIEAQLLEHPSVGNCAVLAWPRPEAPLDRRLVAYVVPEDAAPEGVAPEQAAPEDAAPEDKAAAEVEAARDLQRDLGEHLRQRLPEYMLPQAWVALPELPLTRNGKLDRAALPEPEATVTETYVAPRDETETELAALWAEVLGQERVGIHDRFFDLGGHSLLAVQLLSRIKRQMHSELSLQQFFDNPTVEGMAAIVSASVKDQEVDELDALFSQVEDMSPDQILAALNEKEQRGQE